MKEGIHPAYRDCKVTCACGNTFMTKSTKDEIRLELENGTLTVLAAAVWKSSSRSTTSTNCDKRYPKTRLEHAGFSIRVKPWNSRS